MLITIDLISSRISMREGGRWTSVGSSIVTIFNNIIITRSFYKLIFAAVSIYKTIRRNLITLLTIKVISHMLASGSNDESHSNFTIVYLSNNYSFIKHFIPPESLHWYELICNLKGDKKLHMIFVHIIFSQQWKNRSENAKWKRSEGLSTLFSVIIWEIWWFMFHVS